MTSATVPPPEGIRRWVLGSRPRTLPAAVVPVAVGASAAAADAGFDAVVWWRVGMALVVSLALQVGVNYANDYSDGVRGTDEERIGPLRLVASGLASPSAVKRAALLAFGVAAVAGLGLAATTSWWLIAVGAISIVAAWGYTGGPRPYGYAGLGEVFVFVFFGLVATMGTTFVAIERVTSLSFIVSIAVGALACSLLVVNNLRDLPTDRQVGKMTLAVRLGDRRTRLLYLGLLSLAVIAVLAAATVVPAALLGLIAVPFALGPIRAVRSGATGLGLIPVLGATGMVQLAFGLGASFGFLWSAVLSRS